MSILFNCITDFLYGNFKIVPPNASSTSTQREDSPTLKKTTSRSKSIFKRMGDFFSFKRTINASKKQPSQGSPPITIIKAPLASKPFPTPVLASEPTLPLPQPKAPQKPVLSVPTLESEPNTATSSLPSLRLRPSQQQEKLNRQQTKADIKNTVSSVWTLLKEEAMGNHPPIASKPPARIVITPKGFRHFSVGDVATGISLSSWDIAERLKLAEKKFQTSPSVLRDLKNPSTEIIMLAKDHKKIGTKDLRLGMASWANRASLVKKVNKDTLKENFQKAKKDTLPEKQKAVRIEAPQLPSFPEEKLTEE